MPTITLYTKPFCPYCNEARSYLNDKGITFEEKNVIADEAAFNEMKEKSGQSLAPVMEWDGEILSDFGVEELEVFLKNKGV